VATRPPRQLVLRWRGFCTPGPGTARLTRTQCAVPWEKIEMSAAIEIASATLPVELTDGPERRPVLPHRFDESRLS
jgi:hypothetical protein